MFIQDIDSVWNLKWSDRGVTYSDIFLATEKEYSHFNFSHADLEKLMRHFTDMIEESKKLIGNDLVYPAYDYCLKASHIFNLLEARGALSVSERVDYISKIRDAARLCASQLISRESS